MRFFRALWFFVRGHRIATAVGLLFFTAYFSTWIYRRELGIVHPMANLRYFYFGAYPATFSDRALYWLYYPAYRPYLGYQMLRYGERYDIHWGDSADPYDPSAFH